MTAKSKIKGNTLEREVRDILNEIFDTKEFARTPGSGAIMGLSNAQKNMGLNKQTQQTLGSDIICPDWFKFSIECKSYADDPNYSTIIASDNTVLNGWLGEAIFDSRTLELTPMLVFKTTRKGTFVAIPTTFELPSSVTHYLHYDHFWIIGMEVFKTIAKELNEQNEQEGFRVQIQEFIRTEKMNDLVNNMLTSKEKKKTKKK